MENEDITALLLGLCEITKRQVEAVRDLQIQSAGLRGTLSGYERDRYKEAAKTSTPEIVDSLSSSLDWLKEALRRLSET